MPLVTDPNFRLPIVLPSDVDKPADKRPTFYFRAISAREWRQFLAADSDEGGPLEQLDRMLTTLRSLLVDWKHIGIPFDPEKLEDVIGPFEVSVLAEQLLIATRLSTEQKKRSDDSSPTTTEESADTAEPASA